jgi:hypothetical protein
MSPGCGHGGRVIPGIDAGPVRYNISQSRKRLIVLSKRPSRPSGRRPGTRSPVNVEKATDQGKLVISKGRKSGAGV